MISKKAKEYEDKQAEKHEERYFMTTHNKCPHCMSDIESITLGPGVYDLKCQACGLTR